MIKDIYRELYHYDAEHTLVMNTVTQDILMCKTSPYSDIEIYKYLKEHPDRHFPRIDSFWKEDGKVTVVEEFIQGHTFDSVIADKELSANRKLDYLIDICKALSILHSAPLPIIHRDIKPDNIIVNNTGNIKIVDFDSAKIYREGSNKDTILLGTEGYAAPEQYGFGQSDKRTDVYTMGILIKDMFPYDHKLCRIAAKATSMDPARRYQTIDELAGKLEGAKSIARKDTLNPLLPIPGFRQGKQLNRIVAIVGYLAISMVIGCAHVDEPEAHPQIIYKIAYIAGSLSAIDICTDWTGLYQNLPFIRSNKKLLRYPAKAVFSFLFFMFWAIAASIILRLFF